ncbi:MAG TPA: TSUP family transporter, partial [Vicinamibacterales bacterium]|nr:TSUP family transporter [Vicinamibacterales bacterium]
MSFLIVFIAAFLAGAINSVAGGGTLLTFPALIWAGLPSTIANATSTVAIWPGSLGGVWGYRHDLPGLPKSTYSLIIPGVLGGIA